MRRSTFIKSAVAVFVAAAVPLVYYKLQNKGRYNPLYMPDVLSRFCDEKEIYEIGMQYRLKVPAENNKEKLMELLLSGNESKKNVALSNSVIDNLLNKNIKDEYSVYKTMVVKGWVISLTEARQCALFSLYKKQDSNHA